MSSLALAPMIGWAQTAPQDPAIGQAADKIAAATDTAEHLTVDVRIDGAGPFRFVVDTGADRTVISEEVAASLGLVRGRQVMLNGIVRSLAADTVLISNFSLGPVVRKNLELPVLPRSLLQADGYLGLDTVDGLRVTFDFRNHALEIGKPHSGFASTSSSNQLGSDNARLLAEGSSGHLRAVDCYAGDVPAAAFIDSGAEVSIGNPPLLAALLARHPTRLDLGSVQVTGITGGQVAGRLTMIDRIRLQRLEFTDCALVIVDLQVFDIWGLSKQPALLIGMNYLRQFSSVAIDYRLKEIRFDLASLMVAGPA
ncbi:MAG TPA: aspartyl protease family protein [Steroidobacteraceae bacterium]|nr:aspartyl protease family protein [Steroidobacteraceae bacterium]